MPVQIASLFVLAILCAAAAAEDLVIAGARRPYTIVDAMGQPIPLADVVLTTRILPPPGADATPADGALQTVTGFTNKFGQVALPDFSEVKVTVTARLHHRDYGTARCQIERAARAGTIRFPVVRAGSEAHARALQGIVSGPDGKPVVGAVIHCDSVRTPGEGLINPVHPPGEGLTDEEGRFTFYLPNENRDRQRGNLIPLKSHYSLLVSGPEGDSYFPCAGRFANDQIARIELPRPTRMHRLRFAAPDGGRLEDPEALRQVYVNYVTERDGQRSYVPLDSQSVFRGRRLPPGKYLAERLINGKTLHFQPLIVAGDSPAELVFQLPDPVTFHGRVVHGISGKPMPKAFVMGWHGLAHNNLALLSADDWKLLHELPAAPEVDEPAIRRLCDCYLVQCLVRTLDDGKFEITQQPDQDFYGLLAFDEDLVPYRIHVGTLRRDDPQRIAAGEFPLFPAAKVLVRPVFDGQHLPISPKWLPTEAGQPEWIDRFRAAARGYEREFEYVHWLKLNVQQAIYVPAGVRLQMRFETPYNDEWCPTIIDKPLQLEAQQVLEIGDLRLSASLPATVRVIDSQGNPVEGAAVRRMYTDERVWSVAHNTDKKGIAHFHLHPGSKGQFRVYDMPGRPEPVAAKNLVIAFETGKGAPGQPFEIIVTDEQLRLLRGDDTK
jgi:hypothetical protein